MNDALTTRAYIPLRSDNGSEMTAGTDPLIFANPIREMMHRELVPRDQAEAYITRLEVELTQALKQIADLAREKNAVKEKLAAAKDENDESSLDIKLLTAQLAAETRCVETWKDVAKWQERNVETWQNIVTNIGVAIGRPAHTADDGAVYKDPLALRVQEIVVAAYTPRNRFVRALRMLVRGF